jgi:hypothetical protein
MRISWASGIGAGLLIGLGLMLGGCGGSGQRRWWVCAECRGGLRLRGRAVSGRVHGWLPVRVGRIQRGDPDPPERSRHPGREPHVLDRGTRLAARPRHSRQFGVRTRPQRFLVLDPGVRDAARSLRRRRLRRPRKRRRPVQRHRLGRVGAIRAGIQNDPGDLQCRGAILGLQGRGAFGSAFGARTDRRRSVRRVRFAGVVFRMFGMQ